MRLAAIAVVLVAVQLGCGGSTRNAASPRDSAVEHRYRVPAEVGALVVDDGAFAAFAKTLRTDAEADLRGALEVKAKKDRLFVVALLDALDERWPQALARIDEIAALESEPKAKAMTGLTIRVWAGASGAQAGFREALERELAKLPLELVRQDLVMLRTMGQVFTPEVCRQLVNESIKPRDGTVGLDDAQAITFQRYAAKRLAPVGPAIDEVLGAHGIAARTQ